MEKAVEAVISLEPDMVGITVMGLPSIKGAASLVERLQKSCRPGRGVRNFKILAGGHGASMLPEVFLDAGADAIVIGEGELTMRQILENGIDPGAPGLVCKVGERMIAGPFQELIRPMDRLQPPARDLMPPPGDGIHLMETSRGCPHSCDFCETTRFYGRSWRPHSPERVAAEVIHLVEGHDAWIIHFADDNFAASPKRVLEICEAITKGPMPMLILASARADDLLADSRVIPAMAKARILRVSVGVETLDPQTAAAAGKPIPFETYREAFTRMREYGIFTVTSFIIGVPGETRTSRKRAVEMAIEAGPDSAHFLPYLPLPGTPLATHRSGIDPDPADVRWAQLCSKAFFDHPTVQKRLRAAVIEGGARGLLAQATIDRVNLNPDPGWWGYPESC